MATMPKEVMDVFNDREASKVLATVDAGGTLNAVPKGTLAALDEETIVFAEIYGGKTKENLEATRKAAATAFNRQVPAVGYQVKGAFQRFETSGELFDRFARRIKEMLGLEVKAVGFIKVEEVYAIAGPQAGKKLA